MFATILEVQTRSGREIPDGGGHEDLARGGHALDSSADVDSDASQSAPLHLAFPGVDAGVGLEAKAPPTTESRACAVDGIARGLEAHEEAVARRILMRWPNEMALSGRRWRLCMNAAV